MLLGDKPNIFEGDEFELVGEWNLIFFPISENVIVNFGSSNIQYIFCYASHMFTILNLNWHLKATSPTRKIACYFQFISPSLYCLQ